MSQNKKPPQAELPQGNTPQGESPQGDLPQGDTVQLTALQIADLFSSINQLHGLVSNVVNRMDNLDLSQQLRQNHDEPSVLPPRVSERGARRPSIVLASSDPQGLRSNARDRVPLDSILRTQVKVAPEQMGKTMTLNGVHFALKSQIDFERQNDQFKGLPYFLRQHANLEIVDYVNSNSANALFGNFTESSIYLLTDEQYLPLTAATIRAKNRTAVEIATAISRSLPELEIDKEYQGGFLLYHTHVFGKMSKLFADMEWRTKFIYTDAKSSETKLWPEEKYGKRDRPGFFFILMTILDKHKRLQFSEMFIEHITEDKLKTLNNFADFYKALRASNLHFCEKAREFEEEQSSIRKPKTIDEMRQLLHSQDEQRLILPRGNLPQGNSPQGRPPQGEGNYKPFLQRRPFHSPQRTVRLIGDGFEETFMSPIQTYEMDESNYILHSLMYDAEEDDVGIHTDRGNHNAYVNSLQSTGFKKVGNLSSPPKKMYPSGTPLRKPGSSIYPCFTQFEEGPNQCADTKCQYSHSEKDMILFRDSMVKRLVKSPYSHGVEQLVDLVRSTNKSLSHSAGQVNLLMDQSNVSGEHEEAVVFPDPDA